MYVLFHFSRDVAETSPYYEALKKDDVEVGLFRAIQILWARVFIDTRYMTVCSLHQVLFSYNEQDDITMHYLGKFEGKNIMAAENYFSVDREVKPAESAETIEADQTSGKYRKLQPCWNFSKLGISHCIMLE